MNRKQVRKIRKLTKKLSSEQLASLHVIGDYVAEQRKRKFIEELPEEDREALLSIIPCITFASEHDVKKLNSSALYKRAYTLLKESEASGEIAPELNEIYSKQLSYTNNYLHLKKGRLIRNILSNSASNYNKLKRKSPNKAKTMLENCISRASDMQREHLKTLDDLLFFHKHYPIFLRLTPALLKTKLSEGDHLSLAAAIITNPKLQLLQLIHLDDAWDSFPLKWYINNLPTTAGRILFEMFKEGHDISEVFASNYIDGEFKSLSELLSSQYITPPISHVLCSRSNVIKDVLACFKQKIYSAAVCTALTVIEGVLWDFSKEYNHIADVKIYSDDECSALLLVSGKTMENFTIGNLLKQTFLGNLFDKHFISYFCDELYNERNPILHGQNTESFTIKNSAKKIATIEYILRRIEAFNKGKAMQRIEENLPTDIKDKIISNHLQQ